MAYTLPELEVVFLLANQKMIKNGNELLGSMILVRTLLWEAWRDGCSPG